MTSTNAVRLPYPLDHASHVPILIGLAHNFTVTRVYEYGAGYYSTPLFLNRQVFVEVEEVVSVETDAAWRNILSKSHGDDPRLRLVSAYDPPDDGFELTLIDNGPMQHKVDTIRDIVASDYRGIIVVHDSEVGAYRDELEALDFLVHFDSYNPSTCVGSNGGTLLLMQMRELIQENHNLPVTDVLGWSQVFAENPIV